MVSTMDNPLMGFYEHVIAQNLTRSMSHAYRRRENQSTSTPRSINNSLVEGGIVLDRYDAGAFVLEPQYENPLPHDLDPLH